VSLQLRRFTKCFESVPFIILNYISQITSAAIKPSTVYVSVRSKNQKKEKSFIIPNTIHTIPYILLYDLVRFTLYNSKFLCSVSFTYYSRCIYWVFVCLFISSEIISLFACLVSVFVLSLSSSSKCSYSNESVGVSIITSHHHDIFVMIIVIVQQYYHHHHRHHLCIRHGAVLLLYLPSLLCGRMPLKIANSAPTPPIVDFSMS